MKKLTFINGEAIYSDLQREDIIAPSAEDIRYGILAEINTCKEALSATDYKAIKFAEGLIPIADYEPIKAERQALRDRINELEKELN